MPLWTPAPSVLQFKLDGAYVRFEAQVGIDTAAGNFTYGSSIPGSPSLGLTKLGATVRSTNARMGCPARLVEKRQ